MKGHIQFSRYFSIYLIFVIKFFIESKGEFISEISINITSYGLNSKYILQSSEGFFVGERTKIWTLKNNRNRFQYFLKRNVSKTILFKSYY